MKKILLNLFTDLSKVEVKVGRCLWIELTYEVVNQIIEKEKKIGNMKIITGDQPDHGRELQKVKHNQKNVCHLSKLALPVKPAQVLCRGKLRRVQREKG